MAVITIHDEGRTLSQPHEISTFLEPHGIWYEQWDVAGRIGPDASNEQILEAYAPEIERLNRRGGFVTADIIQVHSDTPGLEAMLDRFRKEHTHDEDEVRFTVRGQGVFHIHPTNGPVFAIQVGAGDLINVPRGTRHWFDLCDDRTICCIRLFQDSAGWTPHYIEGSSLHQQYQPLCWGPNYLPADGLARPDEIGCVTIAKPRR